MQKKIQCPNATVRSFTETETCSGLEIVFSGDDQVNYRNALNKLLYAVSETMQH
jgi:hypothetical protein